MLNILYYQIYRKRITDYDRKSQRNEKKKKNSPRVNVRKEKVSKSPNRNHTLSDIMFTPHVYTEEELADVRKANKKRKQRNLNFPSVIDSDLSDSSVEESRNKRRRGNRSQQNQEEDNSKESIGDNSESRSPSKRKRRRSNRNTTVNIANITKSRLRKRRRRLRKGK